MEIGKYYYVVTHENRMFTGEIVSVYADSVPGFKMTHTTLDVNEAQLFEDYKEALESAESYGMEVKKVRADILGLGSR
ncbi:hypothetical protein [Staphylococcus xylosus]|uniref:hypothetical protein n=1 Tax=Staphylococcus xylosus TaxID=1288 RepID=UPI001951C59A|nr:hypothetical protein [Staphylococcus xylosus]MBM6637485.1 hypothetical protein [Staphylococcus xylosus]